MYDKDKRRAYDAAHRSERRARDAAYYAAHPEKQQARSAAYNAAHPERRRASVAAYNAANSEKIRARSIAYRVANPEKARAYNAANREKQRAYRVANPEKKRAGEAKRRAHKANAEINDFTADQWEELLEECGELCWYCRVAGADLEQEHLVPLSRGGNHTRSNIVPACRSCNARKHTRTAEEFLAVGSARA